MGQNAPHYVLDKLPPLREKVETIRILRQTNKSTAALAELKGIARSIPNQTMLINAIVLQEAKDSSEIENIITTQDELYKALIVNKTNISPEIKEVVNYRKAIFQGFDLVKNQEFLRVNDIVTLQQELVDNMAGIRNTPGTVLKNDKTGEVVYTPPQDKVEILDLLTHFISHFNQADDLSPLITMAIINYQFESIDIAISASVGWYEKSFSFPMNIAIFGGSCLLDAEHLGDKLEVLILDSTIVGNITQDIVVSSNEIYVSASVIANIKMGYVVTLYDGVNTNVLGRVKSIDIENNKITMEFSTTDSFSAFTPTYVKMSVYLARYCYLHGVGEMRMGGKVGSSLVPANTSMKLRYYNSNAVAKKFSFIFEYFY